MKKRNLNIKNLFSKLIVQAKTNKTEIIMSCVLGFVFIVLSAVMFMQFRTIEETNITDIENMREAELRELVSTWKTKYEETNTKLAEIKLKTEEYNQKISNNQEASELMNKELEESRLLLGKTDVEGQGIIVTLSDNKDTTIKANDLLELVNELNYAGAEAISINDVRITNMSEIVEVGGVILAGNKNRLSSPYVVKAIGDQKYLSSILSLKDTGYIDKYTNSGKTVKLETSKKIFINKMKKEMKADYIKEVTEE